MLLAGCFWPMHGRAQTGWTPVKESSENSQSQQRSGPNQRWDAVPQSQNTKSNLVWEPLSPEQADTAPEDLIWSEPSSPADVAVNEQQNSPLPAEEIEPADGLRWPNGQLMSAEDQIYYRSAWSRGSMVQIGDTVYPNIGMNALQRAPGSWVELGITAIDDSWQWFGPGNKPDDCSQGNFFSVCADGLMQNNIRLWSSPAFSAELNWTIHSLSGEGSPFTFTVGDNVSAKDDSGTKFGQGQSLGFRIAKNFGKTFGISIGGNRLWHFDDTTDLVQTPLHPRHQDLSPQRHP